jgi:hypothetical protein
MTRDRRVQTQTPLNVCGSAAAGSSAAAQHRKPAIAVNARERSLTSRGSEVAAEDRFEVQERKCASPQAGVVISVELTTPA